MSAPLSTHELLELARTMRWRTPANFHDKLTEAVYSESSKICERNVVRHGFSRLLWQQRLDSILISPWTGFPAMILVMAAVLWITIIGANVPSGMLSSILVEKGVPFLHSIAAKIHLWEWLQGFLIDGMYLTMAWVVSVMLPPMAIFFPLFTILEDFGYLPRVAFNLDRIFQKVGAHGKQALTQTMGFGCNAAGVIATRVIDSPRERLIAIITNNFALCNGRWPTQILVATIFIGALVPREWGNTVAMLAVLSVAILGFGFTFLSSWLLSRTILKGESSTFSLELPPYRPPNILRTLYTSLVDRTIFVLWRAIVFAIPAGAVIWLISNISISGQPIAYWMTTGLDPLAYVMGLTGVILVAYIVAIPANEIVIPTILMLTVLVTGLHGHGQGAGVIFDADDLALRQILQTGGWTTLTGICLMLFSLCHNPCSTTIYTIYKETRSAKWTAIATVLPIVFGFILCSAVAFFWRLFTV